eukprot:586742-Amphidinium_carterae.1
MGSTNISREFRNFHNSVMLRSPLPMTVRLTHLSRHLRAKVEPIEYALDVLLGRCELAACHKIESLLDTETIPAGTRWDN